MKYRTPHTPILTPEDVLFALSCSHSSHLMMTFKMAALECFEFMLSSIILYFTRGFKLTEVQLLYYNHSMVPL